MLHFYIVRVGLIPCFGRVYRVSSKISAEVAKLFHFRKYLESKIGSASSGKSSHCRLLVVRQLPSKAYLCMGIMWDCWSICSPCYLPRNISIPTSHSLFSTISLSPIPLLMNFYIGIRFHIPQGNDLSQAAFWLVV